MVHLKAIRLLGCSNFENCFPHVISGIRLYMVMTPTHAGDVKNSATEGLPAKFVLSMRTLFDILDDKRTGYVKFSGKFYLFLIRNIFFLNLVFSIKKSKRDGKTMVLRVCQKEYWIVFEK